MTPTKDSVPNLAPDTAFVKLAASHHNPKFRSQLNALMIAGFCSMASARVCDSMLPMLASELGGTVSSVSQVIASFAFAYGLLQLLFGPLGDRFGKLRVIFFACMAASLGAAACALSQNLTALTWARFFAGATAAGVIPLAIAWIGDSVAYAERQAVMARFLAGTVTGLILGQILGGLASDTVGWRGAFWMIAIIYSLSALRLWSYRGAQVNQAGSSGLRTEPSGRQGADSNAAMRPWWAQVFPSYWRVLKKPAARLVLPVILAEGSLVFSAMAFVPSFVHDRDAVSLSWASLAVAGFGMGGLLYAWQSQAWLKRLGEAGFARIGASLFGLGLCALAWLPGFACALIACFTAGVGFYMLHNTLQTLGSQVSPESRGAAMSLFAFSLFAGSTIGISCAAWAVAHFGYRPVFMISGVLTASLGFRLAAGLPKLIRSANPS